MLAADVTSELPPLGAPVEGAPWARRVIWARARLDCDWPATCAPRILRGAVCEQIERQGGASVSWHNHGDDAQSSQRPSEVHYRILNGRPELWMLGPRTPANLARLARVGALTLPAGGVLPIRGMDVEHDEAEVQYLGKTWRHYRLATPIFPSRVVDARRPREDGPVMAAWAGQYLTSAIKLWFLECGLQPESIALHVSIIPNTLRLGRVSFDRPSRGQGSHAQGFMCEFLTNAKLAPYAALGAHRSEGWGVLHVD